MKIVKNSIRIMVLILSLAVVVVTGCNEESEKEEYGGEDGLIFLSITAVSGSINQDQVFWEDRVDELRMLVFSSEDGQVVFNQKLYFPDGFTGKSQPVQLPMGIYNFYFIANETVYTGDFTEALTEIQNESAFTSDTRFTTLSYNPAFYPDGNSEEGRFVMSAVYHTIEVTSGGTESNPLPLAVPDGKVELIRSLAKVEVTFRKKSFRKLSTEKYHYFGIT